MRVTEFWERMDAALPTGYARSWAHDVVVPGLGGHTVEQALAVGTDPKMIWRAVHALLDLPAADR